MVCSVINACTQPPSFIVKVTIDSMNTDIGPSVASETSKRKRETKNFPNKWKVPKRKESPISPNYQRLIKQMNVIVKLPS